MWLFSTRSATLSSAPFDRLDLFEDVDAVNRIVVKHAEYALDMAADRQQPALRVLAGAGIEMEPAMRRDPGHDAASAR